MTVDAAILTARLTDSRWSSIEVVEATGSTNADLVARAASEPIAGTVRITTDQTAGRGRHARAWSAPAGAQLAISAAVGAQATEHLGWLSLLAGLAAVRAIEDVAAVRPVLKWPNDVLVDEQKVAGILSEYTVGVEGGVAVIGTGINTDMTAEDLPVSTATSLRLITGRDVEVTEVAGTYLRALAELLDLWPADIEGLAERYRDRSDTLGRRVRLELPGDRIVVGTAVAVDDEGRIVIDADGERVVAAAGDVTHLRPVD